MSVSSRIVSLSARGAASGALAALTFAVAVHPVAAQTAPTRWQPWLGCWAPASSGESNIILRNGPQTSVGSVAGANGGMLCVVPAPDDNAVDLVTVNNNRVVHRERVIASASQIARTRDNCPGWESATWSADNHRVLLRSEFVCGSNAKVSGSGIFAISADGDFVQIQGTKVGANSSSRVVRYQSTGFEIAMTPGASLNDSSAVTLQPVTATFSISTTRTVAAQPLTPSAIAEVSKSVETPVAIAWLNEIGQRYNVDSKQLVALSNAGVSPAVLDMMVALSYPEKFEVRRNDGVGGGGGGVPARVTGNTVRDRDAGSSWDCGYGSRMMPFGYYGDSCCPGYAYGYDPYYASYGYGRYGYGYNPYNYYYGYQPVVIVPSGSGGSSDSPATRGRAVKGGGYTAGSDGSSRTDKARPTSSSGSSTTSSSQQRRRHPLRLRAVVRLAPRSRALPRQTSNAV